MESKIPKWISFTGQRKRDKILCCTECPVKEQLQDMVARYHVDSIEFARREEELLCEFGLEDSEKRFVHYGLTTPSNMAYKKYIDILNNDLYLNKLSEDIHDVLLEGNLLIIKSLDRKGINPCGYDIDSFLKMPEHYYEEIFNLVKSLSGYEHIHLVDDLILFELPARAYITDSPDIMELVDLWINNLEIFV